MFEEWKDSVTTLAAAHWTPERLQELTGGKALLVTPDRAPVLLRALGLLHRDASMPPKEVRKFLQLNHMLRSLRPCIDPLLALDKPLTIVDAGCGRSYLTLSLAWCFEHVWKRPVRIIGIDRNHALIEECKRRTDLTELSHLMEFVASPLEAFEADAPIDFLISLHACDTATDDAIALGVRQQAAVIAVAPCCQNELARGWEKLAAAQTPGGFSPMWNIPQFRQTSASIFTDTFRALLLSGSGYKTDAMEFVASSHTPKNTLIRAVKETDFNQEKIDEYLRLRDHTGGVGIKLETLILGS